MEIKAVTTPVTIEFVEKMAKEQFGDIIKATEFDSMINIRPSQGNMSRDVEDTATRKQITDVVERLVVSK